MRPLNGLSRRGFLGAGAVGLGVLGAVAGWTWFGANDACYRALVGDAVPNVLTIKELAILGALAEAMIAPSAGAPTAHQAETARRIDRELVFHSGSKLISDIKSSLLLLEHAPIMDMMGSRFTALSATDRAAFLEGSARSQWALRRLAYAGVKFLILFFYYSDDRTWRSIGYGGPAVAEKIFEGGNRIANLPSLARHQTNAG